MQMKKGLGDIARRNLGIFSAAGNGPGGAG